MEGRQLIPIEDIKHALVARILELCRDILPNGVRQANEWRVGSLSGETGTSLGVHLSGPRAGIWCDFAGGPENKGDLLKLIALAVDKCHGDRKEAVKWAVRWLGLDDGGNSHKKTTTVNRDNPESNYRAIARNIYLDAQPELRGTPVEAYLAGRGIDLARFDRRPHFLRFDPLCWNSETQRPWPAMIAAVVDHNGQFLSAHRTWLEVLTSGLVRKAPIVQPKKTLGSPTGGLIPLWPGLAGEPWPHVKSGEVLMLAEGIEDGLSCARLRPSHRAAAAGSVGNMAKLVLPQRLRDVRICAQNDPCFNLKTGEIHEVMAALDQAVRNFQRQGAAVRIARPPEGKDFSDWLQKLTMGWEDVA